MKDVEREEGKVKICFSSRHYPILGPNTIPTISVEWRNDKDIQLVIQERLRHIDLEAMRQQIEKWIRLKARGGFQWAVLITDGVVKEYANGTKAENLHAKLTATPGTLNELYTHILSDITEDEKHHTTKLFQWVLFAERPLSSQELREALATDKGMVCTTVSDLRRHDCWIENLGRFETYVQHISRGLVQFQTREIWEQYEPEGENSDREARFIHQSVAAYVLEEFLNNTSQSQIGAGHFEISRSCLKYMMLREVLEGARLPRGTLSAKFPLIPYVVRFLFHHIQRIEREGIPQPDLLSLIQWNRQSESLRKIANLCKVLDPDSAHTPIGWSFIGATPLHVEALAELITLPTADGGIKGNIVQTLRDLPDSSLDKPSLIHPASPNQQDPQENAQTGLALDQEWSRRPPPTTTTVTRDAADSTIKAGLRHNGSGT